MSRQFWQETLSWAVSDGAAVANTATETVIFPDTTIPGGYMADGRLFRLTAFGVLSTTGTPTMTFAIRWGGVSGTLLFTTEAITNGSGVTNANWRISALIQTRGNGSSGSVIVAGECDIHTSATAVARNIAGVSGFDAMAAVTADLSIDQALSLTAKWSAASSSNTLTGKLLVLESLN